MRYLLILSCALLIGACQSKPVGEAATSSTTADTPTTEPAKDPIFLLTPGLGFGNIKPGLTSAELRQLLGKGQLQEQEFYLGEGYFEPGLVLYPGTAQELEVHLVNDTVNLIRITRDSSAWQTVDGITIGSTLAEVAAANGRNFELTGFDWDYGGTVTDWQAGTLGGKDLLMRFTIDYGTARVPDADVQAIAGDQVISSANPILAKYRVTVNEITQRQP